MWLAAIQLRKDVKETAQKVVKEAYKLSVLSPRKQSLAAAWLLNKTTIRIQGGTCYEVPNFVFGGLDIKWDGDAVDAKVSLQHHKTQ